MLSKRIVPLVLVAAVAGACGDTESPPPSVIEVLPDAFCGAGPIGPWFYAEIRGADFAATDPYDLLQRPRLFRVGDDDVLRLVPSALLDRTLLVAQVPTYGQNYFEPPEVFDVIVENPDGQQAVLEDAYTIYATPVLEEVSVSNESDPLTLTLTGQYFYGPLSVTIGSTAHTNQGTTDSPTSATAIFYDPPLGLDEPGFYPVTVANEAGCSSTLDLAYQVE